MIAAKLEEENGIETSADRILVTPGSNYGIMIALSVLLNPKDEVLVEGLEKICHTINTKTIEK